MSAAKRILLRPNLFTQNVSQQRTQRIFGVILRQARPGRAMLQARLQSTFAEAPKQPPLILRLLGQSLFAVVCFSLGSFAGFAVFPQRGAMQALLNKPPSDAESNGLYEPPDAATATINEHVLQHALARSLRANPDFIESRPHMKIPEALRATNLTGGTLAGPGRIAVPPVQFAEKDGKSLVSIVYLGEQLCGHPGLVHGGLLATLLDEGLARCCIPALPNKLGVTANLNIDYRRPVKADGYYVLKAHTQSVEGRKATVTGWIEPLGDEEDGIADGENAKEAREFKEPKEPQKLVEARGLFIEPRNARAMRTLYRDRT